MGIGDEVMATGQAAVAQRADPRRVRLLHEGRARWHPVWENNPRLARPDEQGDFQIVHAREGWKRPYVAGKTEQHWKWRAYRPEPGEFYFSAEELAFGERYAGRVIVEPHIKAGASPNKQWGWDRWGRLVGLIHGLPVAQLGPPGARRLGGVESIQTGGIRLAAAVIARARAVVTHEGALHHIAAAVNVPCVVIRGGYVSPKVTGYAGQVDLFVGDDVGCGARLPCGHCQDAMRQIEPAAVMAALTKAETR